MTALIHLADRQLMPVAGGVLIRDHNNAVIGSVGISGDLSDQDEHCAIIGIQAAGFKSEVPSTTQ